MSGLPKFEYSWTFGNTLTLAAMIIGGIGVYADISASIRVQQQALGQYREYIEQLRTTTTSNDARIRSLELGAGRIEERLVSINAALLRIEASLGSDERAK